MAVHMVKAQSHRLCGLTVGKGLLPGLAATFVSNATKCTFEVLSSRQPLTRCPFTLKVCTDEPWDREILELPRTDLLELVLFFYCHCNKLPQI